MMAGRTLEYIAGAAPRYSVIGAAAVVKTTSGENRRLERGAWLPTDAAQQSIEHLLSMGLIRAVGSTS